MTAWVWRRRDTGNLQRGGEVSELLPPAPYNCTSRGGDGGDGCSEHSFPQGKPFEPVSNRGHVWRWGEVRWTSRLHGPVGCRSCSKLTGCICCICLMGSQAGEVCPDDAWNGSCRRGQRHKGWCELWSSLNCPARKRWVWQWRRHCSSKKYAKIKPGLSGFVFKEKEKQQLWWDARIVPACQTQSITGDLSVSSWFPEQMSLGKLEIRIWNVDHWLIALKAAMETYPRFTLLSTKARSVHTILMISTQFPALWVRCRLCAATKRVCSRVWSVFFHPEWTKYTAGRGKGRTFKAKFHCN